MKDLRGEPKGGRIKAPPNGFVLFRADYRAIPDNQVTADGRKKRETEITTDAATAWKELPQVARDAYLGRARRNLAEHKREHREYWSQRRGRDGKFAGALEPDYLVPPHGGGESDGATSSLPNYPSASAGPLQLSPGIFLGLTGSLIPNPDFVPDPPLPPTHSLATAVPAKDIQPFPFPFNSVAPVNDPLQAPSFNSGIPANAMFSTQATAITYNYPQSLSPTMNYSTSYDATCPSIGWGGFGGDPSSIGNNTIMPLQPQLPSTQDLSSRTLTLSNSEWEAIDLFLSTGGPSGANTNAVRL